MENFTQRFSEDESESELETRLRTIMGKDKKIRKRKERSPAASITKITTRSGTSAPKGKTNSKILKMDISEEKEDENLPEAEIHLGDNYYLILAKWQGKMLFGMEKRTTGGDWHHGIKITIEKFNKFIKGVSQLDQIIKKTQK